MKLTLLVALLVTSSANAGRFDALRDIVGDREAFVIANGDGEATVFRVRKDAEQVLFALPLLKRSLPGYPPYYRDFPPITLSFDGKSLLWIAEGAKQRRYDIAKGTFEDVVTEWLPQNDNLEAAHAAIAPSGAAMVCPCYPPLSLMRGEKESPNVQLLLATVKTPQEAAELFERYGPQPIRSTIMPQLAGPVVLREVAGTRQWARQRNLKDFVDIEYVRWAPDGSAFAWIESATTVQTTMTSTLFRPTGAELWRHDVAGKKSAAVMPFKVGELARGYFSHPLHLVSKRTALLSLPEPGWRIPYLNFFVRNDYRVLAVDMDAGTSRELLRGPARIVGIR